jgi:hypothetical protein
VLFDARKADGFRVEHPDDHESLIHFLLTGIHPNVLNRLITP